MHKILEAAKSGDLGTIQTLIEQDKTLIQKRENGRNALLLAAYYDHLDELKWLLQLSREKTSQVLLLY